MSKYKVTIYMASTVTGIKENIYEVEAEAVQIIPTTPPVAVFGTNHNGEVTDIVAAFTGFHSVVKQP